MITGNPSPQTRLTRSELRQLIEDFWGEDIARDWEDRCIDDDADDFADQEAPPWDFTYTNGMPVGPIVVTKK